jgi:hypothetical protein
MAFDGIEIRPAGRDPVSTVTRNPAADLLQMQWQLTIDTNQGCSRRSSDVGVSIVQVKPSPSAADAQDLASLGPGAHAREPMVTMRELRVHLAAGGLLLGSLASETGFAQKTGRRAADARLSVLARFLVEKTRLPDPCHVAQTRACGRGRGN